MARGPKKIKDIDQAKNNPEDVANKMANNKEIYDQEVGTAQDQLKGHPNSHSMPALFGWITQEYQREIANDLVEIGKEIEREKD